MIDECDLSLSIHATQEAMAQRVPEIGNLVESAICHGDASGQYGLFGEAYSACIAADSVAARSEEHSIDGLRAHMDFEVCLYTALGFFNPFLYQIHYNNVVDYMERLPIYLVKKTREAFRLLSKIPMITDFFHHT